MANLKEEAKWEEGIYQYELDDPLQGGEDGIDNVQGRQLANRTQYLKEKSEAIEKDYAKHIQDTANPHSVTAEQLSVYTQQQVDSIVASLTDTDNNIYQTLLHIFQNGYIQWPGMPSPLEDTSLHFEGYSWYEVNYDGNFFRAKGRNAKAFSTKRLTKEQIKDGAYIFQDDEQGDAIRNIKGLVGIEGGVNPSGPFYTESPSPKNVEAWQTSAQEYTTESTCFDASRIVPTAEENRSRNLTFTIWALVKDE